MKENICPICGFNNDLNSKTGRCACCGMSLEDNGTEEWKNLKTKADKAKENLIKKKIEENFINQSTLPKCPQCGSTAIQPAQRGYSLLWGFIGSGKTLNYCMNCGHKWDPKKK